MTALACFVTGTDTGVGKTHAACALLHAARAAGLSTLAMKPVAAGTDEYGRQDDVECLSAAASVAAERTLVNPYCFTPAIAPHIAAVQAGVAIDPERIVAAFRQLRELADAVVVEGAGGFRVPLGPAFDSADLARRLDIPLVLVVGVRLGCLNHALLTVDAIAARKLPLAGWIANRIDPAMSCADENIESLAQRIDAPLLGTLPWGLAPEAAAVGLTLPWPQHGRHSPLHR